MLPYLLNEQVMFENLACLHDPDNGCLQVHLAILVYSCKCLLHLLDKQHTKNMQERKHSRNFDAGYVQICQHTNNIRSTYKYVKS